MLCTRQPIFCRCCVPVPTSRRIERVVCAHACVDLLSSGHTESVFFVCALVRYCFHVRPMRSTMAKCTLNRHTGCCVHRICFNLLWHGCKTETNALKGVYDNDDGRRWRRAATIWRVCIIKHRCENHLSVLVCECVCVCCYITRTGALPLRVSVSMPGARWSRARVRRLFIFSYAYMHMHACVRCGVCVVWVRFYRASAVKRRLRKRIDNFAGIKAGWDGD